MSEEPSGLLVALQLASWNWRVAPGFCSRAGEKIPLCGDWVQNATTDPEKLKAWWNDRSWLWPGIVSGSNSCLVLDCDGKAAIDLLRSFIDSTGWSGGGMVYKTPGRGGGLHCVWSWPDYLGHDFRQAKVHVEGGELQIRGNGHWTLFAGASRPDGVYEIVEEPGAMGPTQAPEDLIRTILRESVVSVGKVTSSDLESISPEDAWDGAPYTDGRKNLVAGLAWFLAIRGSEDSEVINSCVRFGAECCIPPLSEETCVKKAEYAVARAARFKAKQQEEMERSIGRWASGRKWSP